MMMSKCRKVKYECLMLTLPNQYIKNAALIKIKTKENISSKAKGSLPSIRILLGITNSMLIMKIGTM
jgi:hypothetical protein